jgi:hypothetical protein
MIPIDINIPWVIVGLLVIAILKLGDHVILGVLFRSAGRDPIVSEISVVESNPCSTLSTGCYFDAETHITAR